jgi:hypothetical protein
MSQSPLSSLHDEPSSEDEETVETVAAIRVSEDVQSFGEKRLYVGNIDYGVTNAELEVEFGKVKLCMP